MQLPQVDEFNAPVVGVVVPVGQTEHSGLGVVVVPPGEKVPVGHAMQPKFIYITPYPGLHTGNGKGI